MPKGKGSGVTPPYVTQLLQEAVNAESQYAVAKKTGLALSVIQGLLQGNREPSKSTLDRLSAYFGVPVYELRGEIWDALPSELSVDAQELLVEVIKALLDPGRTQTFQQGLTRLLENPADFTGEN